MTLADLQPLFSTIWVVWFFVLFTGILFYALSPKRKRRFEESGNIPFRDDPRDRLS